MRTIAIRLTADEKRILTRRALEAGMTRASYVRMMICDEPLVSGADVLRNASKRMGDARLKVARKK